MKILFYLPAITPWWFDAIVAPMLRTLHCGPARVETHIVTGKLWRNTGIGPEQYLGLADLPGVQWHIVGGEEPETFRRAGADVPGMLDLVAAIDPDLTLARSADFATPARFPGTVRYIMEGAAPPFATDPRWIAFEERPFVHGAFDAAHAGLADACAERLRGCRELAARRPLPRLDLPEDRPILAVPLQYEHEENLFLEHAAFPGSVALIEHLLAGLGDDVLLAVTDHPLNRLHEADPSHVLHVDRRAVDRLIAARPDRIRYCPQPGASDVLAGTADAMLVDLSKTWLLAAFRGTPIVNLSARPVADWLHALPGIAALPTAPSRAALAGPDPAAALRWFGWHVGGRIAAPADLTLERLLRCVAGQPTESDAFANCEMLLARQAQPA